MQDRLSAASVCETEYGYEIDFGNGVLVEVATYQEAIDYINEVEEVEENN